MQLIYSFLVSIIIQAAIPKKNEDTFIIPRFTIPSTPEREPHLNPEAIFIATKNKSLEGSDLPGAFGGDLDLSALNNNYESGSGSSSGSGSGIDEDTTKIVSTTTTSNYFNFRDPSHKKEAETAGKFGSNFVPPIAMNPTMETGSPGKVTEKIVEHNDAPIKKLPAKFTHHAPVLQAHRSTKEKEDGRKILKHDDGKEAHKVLLRDKSKDKNKERHKAKMRENDKIAILSKINHIALALENVESKEKFARRDKSKRRKHLKAKGESAMKAVEALHASVSNVTKDTVNEKNAVSSIKTDDHLEPASKPVTISHADPKGPEGFECPWVCFWTCHSYCPKECCNNPFKCDIHCRELCSPYCDNRCCAPGTRRLPKLQLTFKPQMSDKTPPPELEKAVVNPPMPPAKMFQGATNSQYEAIQQASQYAAKLMGISPDCPLACSRICIPTVCSSQCCTRSRINPAHPPVNAPAYFNKPVVANPAKKPSLEKVGTPRKPVPDNKLTMLTKNGMQPIMPSKLAGSADPALRPNLPAKLRSAPHHGSLPKLSFLPISSTSVHPPSKYNSFRPKQSQLLLRKSESPDIFGDRVLQAKQEVAKPKVMSGALSGRAICPHITSCFYNNLIDPLDCPPICRTSCIPQCPNECCVNNVP